MPRAISLRFRGTVSHIVNLEFRLRRGSGTRGLLVIKEETNGLVGPKDRAHVLIGLADRVNSRKFRLSLMVKDINLLIPVYASIAFNRFTLGGIALRDLNFSGGHNLSRGIVKMVRTAGSGNMARVVVGVKVNLFSNFSGSRSSQ